VKQNLDDPERIHEIRSNIERKPALRALYTELYDKYEACLKNAPAEGLVLELGSGGGFIKQRLPFVITSDILPYTGVDQVIDAMKLPFPEASLRAVFLNNVLHHISDAEAFFKEATRCLVPGGRIFICEPYLSHLSRPIYKFLHHEPCDPSTRDWRFESKGPLSDANNALAWIIFKRDRDRFVKLFPELKVSRFEPHTPLRYWLSGGMKAWTLLPGWGFQCATAFDQLLIKISPEFASFVDIELERTT
jgi:SAM-dependent methyltransferase